MELELGLALPDRSRMMMIKKGLDLNSCSNEMEIEKRKKGGCNNVVVDEEEEVESKSLPLLLWSGQPNDGDERRKWRKIHVDNEESDEDEETVGWPPISSLRRREMLHHHHRGGGMANRRAAAAAASVRNSMYVKVKMEGVPIGRKIHLRIYNSYQALTDSLINMFAKYIKNDSRSGVNYTILYQDKEGDWMLAGDVPWETFVESVQRMEILRNAIAN